ncbi:histone-lysine N-methyltransferase SUVR5-like protein [Trifolium pratense]|uniref:Histone-lysine N-methyltransferase SUVR5-like protein n=1 Tax=Trifolium pratense TaxID=57577 RepID=A0A2K3LQ52_TRIPR|nr:histone-lysine N-methyltransferase SUVR5-like protein [Trifolium pratense]
MQQYIKANWKLHSYESWAERCKNANSAETIELLEEELNGSILWKDVRALWNAPVQLKLSSEWETWKHDVMKCFATFHSFSSNNGTQPEHASSSNSLRQASLQFGTQRPKLKTEELQLHFMSAHPAEFKLSIAPEHVTLSTDDDSQKLIEQGNEEAVRE